MEIVIIIPNNYNYGIAKYIKKKNKDCKVICCFLDIIFEANKAVFQDKNIDEFWTFDKENAKEYNMKYFSQFYTKELKLAKNKIIYDTIFVGREKGRKIEINTIKKALEEKNLKPFIKTVSVEKDFISYDEYLEKVSESKTILDIVDNKQSGMTLRCMESIFFEKKLITNDKSIKQYDFYNPNNIFIFGKDSLDSLVDFINSPYEKISSKIINHYDIEFWINKVTKKEEPL